VTFAFTVRDATSTIDTSFDGPVRGDDANPVRALVRRRVRVRVSPSSSMQTREEEPE
jgi:hypothetical protein